MSKLRPYLIMSLLFKFMYFIRFSSRLASIVNLFWFQLLAVNAFPTSRAICRTIYHIKGFYLSKECWSLGSIRSRCWISRKIVFLSKKLKISTLRGHIIFTLRIYVTLSILTSYMKNLIIYQNWIYYTLK